MRKILEYGLAGVVAYLISRYFVWHIVLPTLNSYPRLTRVMARFPATTLFLILFLTLHFGWAGCNGTADNYRQSMVISSTASICSYYSLSYSLKQTSIIQLA